MISVFISHRKLYQFVLSFFLHIIGTLGLIVLVRLNSVESGSPTFLIIVLLVHHLIPFFGLEDFC